MLIFFSSKIIGGNVFFKILKTKKIYIWFDIYSEIRKLSKFMIFSKLFKIYIFNETYLKVFNTNLDAVFNLYFNFTFSLKWNF